MVLVSGIFFRTRDDFRKGTPKPDYQELITFYEKQKDITMFIYLLFLPLLLM